MKKIYKVLICFVALISVSVLFFTSTVSAAETYRRYQWDTVSGNTTHSFFAFDNNLLTLIDNVNQFDFVSLSNQSSPYTEVFLADVGFDAFVFEYEKSTEITNEYCFFSYAFYSDRVNSGLGDLLQELDKVVLNSATTNFVTFNGYVWGFRYSIRSLVDDYTRSTFLYTTWFQPQVLKSERISNEIWQYTYATPNSYNVAFDSYNLRELPENFVVCLDIILQPEHSFAGLNKNLIGVGIQDASSGALTVYFDESNEALIPTYPELDTPYYEQNSDDILNKMESLNSELIDKNSLAGNMLTVIDNFSAGLIDVGQGMLKVSSLFAALSDRLPIVSTLVWVSLGFGLFAFIVGIVNNGQNIGREKRNFNRPQYRNNNQQNNQKGG